MENAYNSLMQIEKSIQQNNKAHARELFITLKPESFSGNADYLTKAGLLGMDLNLAFEALQFLKRTLETEPSNPSNFNNLGLCLGMMGQFDLAKTAFDQAITLDNAYFKAYHNLGLLYRGHGFFEKARALYELTLSINPQFTLSLLALAEVNEADDNLKQARHYLESVFANEKNNLQAGILNVTLLRREKKMGEALANADEILKNHPNEYNVLFEKAMILHQTKCYSEAYIHFEKANSLADAKTTTRVGFTKECDSISEAYESIGKQISNKKSAVSMQWPIFIVGSPRSGTTLLGQMLGSHSLLYHAGELPFISKLIGKAKDKLKENDFPKLLHTLWEKPDTSATQYLQNIYTGWINDLQTTERPKRVVDKMPANSRLLGFLWNILPGAPVIHIIRDGREVALSAFMQNFKNDQWHAHNLENALVEWQYSIKLARIAALAFQSPYLEIRYEELVKNPYDTLKTVFDFLKLPFEENCITLFQEQKTIKTASYTQVKQPLYTSSLETSRNYPEARAIMNQFAGFFLNEMGYAPDK